MTTLCLDFGNTRLKAAVFTNDSLQEERVLPDDDEATILALLKEFKSERSILSSVINHNPAIENILSEKTTFHKISASTKINFTVPSNKPETIGTDRLALIAAAVHFFPEKNTLIIALGSAVTYNFVNRYRQFLGGSISPGMQMRFKALHQYTAKLPEAKPNWNIPFIGYDTITNLQSGVINGMLFEMEGTIDRYRSKYGNFNVVLTGGDSSYFAGQFKTRIFADLNFLFKGLYVLSEYNNCLP